MRNRQLDCVDAQCRRYCNFYEARCGLHRGQYGGSFPVFMGSRYQNGGGLGDILRGIFRTIFPILAPIATRAATSFVSNTANSLSEGKSLKESAKDALAPTGESILSGAIDAFKGQRGSGSRKRGRRKQKKQMVYKVNKIAHKHKCKSHSKKNSKKRKFEFSNF